MKKLIVLASFLFTFVFLYPSFFQKPVQAASCDMTVITTNVQPGNAVQIQIVGAFGGISIANSTFNVYSPSTGKWVDVGSQISEFGGTLSVLNDNDGNPLLIDGINTLIFRQAGLLGSQTDLCSGSVTVSTIPPALPDTCEACSTANPCKQGLSCQNNKCLPGPLPGQGGAGAGCVTNDQCDALNGFTCEGGDNYWCDTNPTNGAGAPGTCTKQVQTGNFNCGNRGGQCAGVVSTVCNNNVTKSNCQGCWINPSDASGANFNESMVGSCVIPDNNGCGSIGGYCCYSIAHNSFSCLQGDVDIEVSSGVCKCKENRAELGGTCITGADCKSSVCDSNKKCGLPDNTCVSGGIDETICKNAGGFYCTRSIPNTGNSQTYCCPSQTQCNQIAPPLNLTKFDGICNGGNGIDTAIGCIPIDTLTSVSKFFITWGLAVGGGVAFLSFIVGSFLIITSSGSPEQLQRAKEILMSSISGVMVLAFAVFLFRVIGVNVLGLF